MMNQQNKITFKSNHNSLTRFFIHIQASHNFIKSKNNPIMSGSAKKKVAPKKVVSPPMIFLICKAIGQIRGGKKGASRAAINNYLVNNNNKTAGAQFNYVLRTALKKGIESGVLRAGDTE
eukprot:368762_1